MTPEPSVNPMSGEPYPVEDKTLFDDVARFLGRFVAFPSAAALDAVVLWIVHSHCLDAFESTPRLALLSPEKGSGKTRTLEVMDLLVPGPMHAVNLSAAALFRQVSTKRVTLLLDEADTYLGYRVAKDHEELRGLINAGHRRGAVAYRCVGEPAKMEVKEFPAFCAAALAGIGDLPDTIIDRSVVIGMRRRGPAEVVKPFRLRKARSEGEPLRKRLEQWGKANLQILTDLEPEMPAGIVDRPADVWEALLAVAHVAGNGWWQRAVDSCLFLNGERQKADTSLGILLLEDIRTVFRTLGDDVDRISSHDLVEKLCEMEESPWGDLRGKPIDPRGVARRLKAYDLHPEDMRIGDGVKKGYQRGPFIDVWERYLPVALPEERATRATSATLGPASVADVADVAHVSGLETGEPPPDESVEWGPFAQCSRDGCTRSTYGYIYGNPICAACKSELSESEVAS